MPQLPDPQSSTHNSGEGRVSFGMNVPVWNRLSGNILQSNGWNRVGNEYHKEGKILRYDGVYFKIEQIKFQWMEQLNEYLTNGKLPEE